MSERFHKRLIEFLKWLAEDGWQKEYVAVEPNVATILNEMIKALSSSRSRKQRSEKLNATILKSVFANSGMDDFRIIAQESSSRPFDCNTALPFNCSVAGDVVRLSREKEGSIIFVYVPWTRYTHGVCFEYHLRPGESPAPEMSVIPCSYFPLSKEDQEKIGSLMCIQVPIEHEEACFVLSISSPKKNFLDIEEFNAARMVARLLPQVLLQAHSGRRTSMFFN